MNYYFSAAVLVPFLVIRTRRERAQRVRHAREEARKESSIFFASLLTSVSPPRFPLILRALSTSFPCTFHELSLRLLSTKLRSLE